MNGKVSVLFLVALHCMNVYVIIFYSFHGLLDISKSQFSLRPFLSFYKFQAISPAFVRQLVLLKGGMFMWTFFASAWKFLNNTFKRNVNNPTTGQLLIKITFSAYKLDSAESEISLAITYFSTSKSTAENILRRAEKKRQFFLVCALIYNQERPYYTF
jgi:hypothetical protein